MRYRHPSDTNNAKDEIQELARQIVIARDGGCIARNEPWHICNGFRKDGILILQADHLLTRANAATYSDIRLIVCVCNGLHGWKRWNKEAYDARIRQLLPKDRIALWDRAHAERYKPVRKYTYDWRMDVAALRQELASYKT